MLVKKETAISPRMLNNLYVFAALVGVLVVILVLAQLRFFNSFYFRRH